MRNQFQRTMTSLVMILSMLFSAVTPAHTGDSGPGLMRTFMHLFTGEHLLLLILVLVTGFMVWRVLRRSSPRI